MTYGIMFLAGQWRDVKSTKKTVLTVLEEKHLFFLSITNTLMYSILLVFSVYLTSRDEL